MNRINYQKKMEEVIVREEEQYLASGKRKRLLLHSCCGPCSTHCIDLLSKTFELTVFYYNPNIYPPQEYSFRAAEQQRFINSFPTDNPVSFLEGNYDPERFYQMARGLETVPEGGERCFKCYELRLRESAEAAGRGNFDYFTTTLSISPLKNAEKLNEIGSRLGEEYGVPYLCSDFKKKDGYKHSTEISREYNMYRQNYCGCVYSIRETDPSRTQDSPNT